MSFQLVCCSYDYLVLLFSERLAKKAQTSVRKAGFLSAHSRLEAPEQEEPEGPEEQERAVLPHRYSFFAFRMIRMK